MTGGTTTSARPVGVEEGEYVVRAGTVASSVDVLPYHASATRSLGRMTKGAMLPFLVSIASIGGPVVPGVRRVFSGAAISRSALGGEHWLLDLDAFYFTKEMADAAEVRALNALLDLPLNTGLELDLGD